MLDDYTMVDKIVLDVPSEVTAFPDGAAFVVGLVLIVLLCAALPPWPLFAAIPWAFWTLRNQRRARVPLVVTSNHVEWVVDGRMERLLLSDIRAVELSPAGQYRATPAGIENGFHLVLHTEQGKRELPVLYAHLQPTEGQVSLDVLVALRAVIGDLARTASPEGEIPAALDSLRRKQPSRS